MEKWHTFDYRYFPSLDLVGVLDSLVVNVELFDAVVVAVIRWPTRYKPTIHSNLIKIISL